MRTSLHLLTLLIFVFALVGCSDGPSNSQLNKAFKDYQSENSIDGVIIVDSIKKTNGYTLDDFYIVEISFDQRFLTDVDGAVALLNKEIANTKTTSLADEMMAGLVGMMSNVGMVRMAMVSEYGNFSAGDVSQATDSLRFIETENGWRRYYD